jgi:D-lactate dehydrogenase (cytochrome)
MAVGTADLDQAQRRLSKIVGTEWVANEGTYLAIRPRTSEEISKLLKFANQTGATVVPLGGGTGWWSPKRPGPGGLLIDMTRMDEVLSVDEDGLTVTAQAGITYAALEKKIAKKGFGLAISPESGRIATLGGHIETWGTSPFSSAFFEDQSNEILSLEVVLPTAEIIRTGTAAVTAAAGPFARRFYPSDLTGLFIGAESAFGVITEVTLKMHGIPEAVLTRMIEYKNMREAVSTVRAIQTSQRKGGLSTVHEQRLMQKETVLLALPKLSRSVGGETRFVLCLRAQGDRDDARSHMRKACGIATVQGGRVIDDDLPEWWERRHGIFPEFVLSKGPRIMLVAITPMGRYERACRIAERFGRNNAMDIMLMGYPLGGPVMLTHIIIRVQGPTPKARKVTLILARKLLEKLMDLGCVPHRVGTDFLPVLVKRLDPAFYRFVQRLKRFLDPAGIMKPGVILPALHPKGSSSSRPGSPQ